MKKFLFILIILSVCTLNATATPKYFSNEKKNNVAPDPIYNKTITVPRGYILSAELYNVLNSENIMQADKIDAGLKSDFIYNGTIIAPEGSLIKGTVVKVTEKTDKETARLLIKFTNISTPNGVSVPISGIIKTEDRTGLLYADNEGIFNNSDNIDIIIMQPVTVVPK